MKEVFHSINMALDSITLTSYCIGVTVILMLIHQRRAKAKHMLWLNLSGFVVVTWSMILVCHGVKETPQLDSILKTMCAVTVNFQMVSLMMSNVDRLLEVLLNIKYPMYVNRSTIKSTVVLTWLSYAVICGVVLYFVGSEKHYWYMLDISKIVDNLYFVSSVTGLPLSNRKKSSQN